MDLVGKVVFLALFTYFCHRSVMSIKKLYAENIGTTIMRKRCQIIDLYLFLNIINYSICIFITALRIFLIAQL